MPIGLGFTRPLIAQTFNIFNLSLGTSAQQINPNGSVQDLITSFIVSNPSANTNSVWLGGAGVAAGMGTEIEPGADPIFIQRQVRQLYEIQNPVIDIDIVARCKTVAPEAIPLIVFDLSRIYLVTDGAAVPVTVTAFPEMWI